MLKYFNNKLNLIGIRCPETIMIVRKTMRSIKCGESILIISDDLISQRDIILFCKFMNHKIIDKKIKNNQFEFLLKKGF